MRLKTLLRLGLLSMTVPLFLLSSCTKKDKDKDPIPTKGPIELNCSDDYYFFHEEQVLKNDPERAVDYIITCQLPVLEDLTIEAGTVIEFASNAGLKIEGSNQPAITAIGTSDKPIIMRGTKQIRGHWNGLWIRSTNPSNALKHVHISDAASTQNANIILYADTRIDMDHVRSTNSDGYGLQANNTNNNITLRNSVFTENAKPAYISAKNIGILHSSNSFSGNDYNYLDIYASGSGGEVTEPSTWYKIDVPYRIIDSYPEFAALVTIQPGVVIESGQDGRIKVRENGGLKAVGTASEPIIFTSISKVQKAWKGIQFHSKHAENEITHAEFHYSGVGEPEGNVWLWYESLLNINHVKFNNIHGCAINYRTNEDGNLTIGSDITVSPEGCIQNVY